MDPSYLELKASLGEPLQSRGQDRFNFFILNSLEENNRLFELNWLTAEEVELLRFNDFYFEWVISHYPEQGFKNISDRKNWREVARSLENPHELNLDVIRLILLKTEPKDMPAFCATSKKYAEVCRNRNFQEEYQKKWNLKGLLPWQKKILNPLLAEAVDILFSTIYEKFTGRYTNIPELKKDLKSFVKEVINFPRIFEIISLRSDNTKGDKSRISRNDLEKIIFGENFEPRFIDRIIEAEAGNDYFILSESRLFKTVIVEDLFQPLLKQMYNIEVGEPPFHSFDPW